MILAAKKTMKIHPFARMFSQVAPLSKEKRDEMVKSIEKNGILIPMLVNKKKDTIYDGATRWGIAYDLKLKLEDDRFEVFPSEDEDDIREAIAARNIDRRQLTDKERSDLISKLFGPKLEEEARQRQSKAGSFKGATKLDGKGSVAEKIATMAGVKKSTAQQSEKLRKAGVLDDVLQKKTARTAALKKAPTRKKAASKSTIPFPDQVYKKWSQFVARFPHPVRREVIELVHGWTKPGAAVPKPSTPAKK
jgi:ParB-like chromosome segregation protein Spo0J